MSAERLIAYLRGHRSEVGEDNSTFDDLLVCEDKNDERWAPARRVLRRELQNLAADTIAPSSKVPASLRTNWSFIARLVARRPLVTDYDSPRYIAAVRQKGGTDKCLAGVMKTIGFALPRVAFDDAFRVLWAGIFQTRLSGEVLRLDGLEAAFLDGKKKQSKWIAKANDRRAADQKAKDDLSLKACRTFDGVSK